MAKRKVSNNVKSAFTHRDGTGICFITKPGESVTRIDSFTWDVPDMMNPQWSDTHSVEVSRLLVRVLGSHLKASKWNDLSRISVVETVDEYNGRTIVRPSLAAQLVSAMKDMKWERSHFLVEQLQQMPLMDEPSKFSYATDEELAY